MESVRTYPERQKFIDGNLTPDRVFTLITSQDVRSRIKDNPEQKMVILVFSSTQAIEHWLKNTDPSFQPEIIDINIVSIEEAEQQSPDIRTIKTCKATPNTFCVCVASWLPMGVNDGHDSMLTHTFSCFACDVLKTIIK